MFSFYGKMVLRLICFCVVFGITQAQGNYEDEEFKFGRGRRKESGGPTVGGMPVWSVAMLATAAAFAAIVLAFCCVRLIMKRVVKGRQSHSNNNSTDSQQCHLCLAKVGRRKWETGQHRRQCARGNEKVLSRLPMPYDIGCVKCGELLRQWPRRGGTFKCNGGRGCPSAMGGRPLLLDNNGANRFACFLCDYNLCRACVQRRMNRQADSSANSSRPASAAKGRQSAASQEPDLLQVREPSIRRLRLEYSDVSETADSSNKPDVVSGQTPQPRILVTAPTNQDLLDQVILQKRRQHQGSSIYDASRASSVVAMTPSLIMRTPSVTTQEEERLSEHPSLRSSEFSSQVISMATSPTPLLEHSDSQEGSLEPNNNGAV